MASVFTTEELAAMAAADAEIEAEFALTQEDLVRARQMDRESVLAGMDHKRRHVAQRQKAYREANREKVAQQQKAYREANREKVAQRQKAWYEANREKVAQQQKAYREAKRLFGGGDA